ncbi:MAG TPA: transketolase C-terminal domain-containing protein [Candidatus Sulfopaludibacter sp.]|jgi:transketolase|nr:transketolase C-terminal domain-containing protein [Candidatus Sulfopaludibacter sp.]
MSQPIAVREAQKGNIRDAASSPEYLLRQGMLRLLAIKDSDVRALTLEQCRGAIDQGLHAGGAFSAVIPLVSLYYGGFIVPDVSDPTRRGQDLFVLSKGHAVAPLAAIYADLGFFSRDLLKGSRSYGSILNGHPGPVLPGIHLATGPMGQGLLVAEGFALAGRTSPRFDCYCLCGDGELQEGTIWEAVMYAGQNHLDNLCVLIDENHGQLDTFDRTAFPMPHLESVFRAFGWNACTVDATQYDGVYAALENFKQATRDGRPTAIVCRSAKGQGAFSDFLNRHKVVAGESLIRQEMAMQAAQREARVEEFTGFCARLESSVAAEPLAATLRQAASQMHLDERLNDVVGPTILDRVPQRDKRIRYDDALLPHLDRKKEYGAAEIVTNAMKVFARDPRVVSIDSDLASTSGLQAGIGAVDQRRALNVGVAEANMMAIGEGYAALGFNTWVSTFCPFFDWKVLRRIAVGYQERLEAMEAKDGWLSQGHGLDLTFLATAANFETRTNGATHMGNDDIIVFDGIAHLKIIDVACPQQLLGVMKWIMDGNRGLTYVRVNRAPSGVLYGADYVFEFGKGQTLRAGDEDRAVIVSSGRGVYEALAAADACAAAGLGVGVVDMPSIDEELLLRLYDSKKVLFLAEQNNGYIWQSLVKLLYHRRKRECSMERVVAINTLDADGKPRFIHSGTYEELLAAFGLASFQLAETIRTRLL